MKQRFFMAYSCQRGWYLKHFARDCPDWEPNPNAHSNHNQTPAWPPSKDWDKQLVPCPCFQLMHQSIEWRQGISLRRISYRIAMIMNFTKIRAQTFRFQINSSLIWRTGMLLILSHRWSSYKLSIRSTWKIGYSRLCIWKIKVKGTTEKRQRAAKMKILTWKSIQMRCQLPR